MSNYLENNLKVKENKTKILNNINEKFNKISNNKEDYKISKMCYGSWITVFNTIKLTKIKDKEGLFLLLNAEKNSILPKREHSCIKEYTILYGEIEYNNKKYIENDSFLITNGMSDTIKFTDDSLLIIKINKNNN